MASTARESVSKKAGKSAPSKLSISKGGLASASGRKIGSSKKRNEISCTSTCRDSASATQKALAKWLRLMSHESTVALRTQPGMRAGTPDR